MHDQPIYKPDSECVLSKWDNLTPGHHDYLVQPASQYKEASVSLKDRIIDQPGLSYYKSITERSNN